MEKSATAFLEEIYSSLTDLKERINLLEGQLADYLAQAAEEQSPAVEEDIPLAENPIEEDIPDETPEIEEVPDIEETPVEEEIPEAIQEIEVKPEEEPVPVEDIVEVETMEIEDIPDINDLPEVEEAPIMEMPIAQDEAPIDIDFELPKSAISINDASTRKLTKSVGDAASEKPRWKTDRPGSPVRNIISAISLNDRVLFIKALFKEDPISFQQSLADLNSMGNIEEAESYISEHFPEWKMGSDVVYRFMMAVRRKLG